MDFGTNQLHEETYRLSIKQQELSIPRMLDLTSDPHFALRLVEVRDTSVAKNALK